MDEQLASAFGRGLSFLALAPAPSAAAFSSLDLMHLAWLYLMLVSRETPRERTFRVGQANRVFVVE